jgi:hypothetical protein
MEFLLVISTIASAIAEGFIDAVRSKKTKIEHYFSFWIRVLLMGVGPAILLYPFKYLYMSIIFTGVLGSIYWIVFDLAFNVMAGNSWGYVGKTSAIDRFMSEIGGPEERLFVKVFVLMFFFMLYDISKTL